MHNMKQWISCFMLIAMVSLTASRVIDVSAMGAVSDDKAMAIYNTAIFNKALVQAKLGDVVSFPAKNFWAVGGIVAKYLSGVTIQIAGTLSALPDQKKWPVASKKYLDFITLLSCVNVTVTGNGVLDGQGKTWWNAEILGKLHAKRPYLMVVTTSTDMKIEKLKMLNSPNEHLILKSVVRAEVGYITVEVDRAAQRKFKLQKKALRVREQRRLQTVSTSSPFAHDAHDSFLRGLEPEDLNTDGIDPSGEDIWIHDCKILNDDDSIAVKPCSKLSCTTDCTKNILIENMVMTGFGASIGSVPPSKDSRYPNCVRNVTFRNISMPNTGKGIYIKSNPSCGGGGTGIIADILYENVRINKPLWWAIWIGPQQQHQPGGKLGDKCSLSYPLAKHCPTQGCVAFQNIVLRNITINEPHLSPGVILGNSSHPMEVTFDNVVVKKPGLLPFNRKYKCTNTKMTVLNHVDPKPKC